VHGSSGYTFDPSTGTITDVRDKTVYVEVDGQPGKEWCYRKNQLTLIKSDSATLKIEAGKFYRTRDGRKVGPAFIVGRCAVFGNGSNYASAVWADDGRSSRRDDKLSLKDNDIIAEWIEEPVAKPSTTTASNDNAQTNFKVGDRVKIVSNSRESYLDKRIGSFFTIKTKDGPNNTGWSGPSEENPYWWPTQDLELANIATTNTTIVALIENGQPKPSSTPHVHTSTGAADKEAKRLAAKFKGK
jgi:hypothetical protein